MHGWANGFECLAAVLSVVLNAPQAWRSCRRRQVVGLSPAARWLAPLASATWVAFGLSGGGALQVLTNTLCGALHVGVLVALLTLSPAARCRRLLVPQATVSAAWLAVVVWAATTGTLPVGALAAACGTVALLPQLVLLARTHGTSGADISGLSPLTAWLTLACSVSWTAYGVLSVSAAVTLPSGLGLLASAATLVLMRRPTPAPRTPVRVPAPRSVRDDLAVPLAA